MLYLNQGKYPLCTLRAANPSPTQPAVSASFHYHRLPPLTITQLHLRQYSENGPLVIEKCKHLNYFEQFTTSTVPRPNKFCTITLLMQTSVFFKYNTIQLNFFSCFKSITQQREIFIIIHYPKQQSIIKCKTAVFVLFVYFYKTIAIIILNFITFKIILVHYGKSMFPLSVPTCIITFASSLGFHDNAKITTP